MQIHASCAARDGAAVLMIGPPGCGKSDLVLRLLHQGFSLVADDQVVIEDGMARAPPALAGLIEIFGLGIVSLDHTMAARLRLVAELVPRIPTRLPLPRIAPDFGLPVIEVDPWHVSAPLRIAVALDCVTGRRCQIAGAFAA